MQLTGLSKRALKQDRLITLRLQQSQILGFNAIEDLP